jgi:uncharacterized NAD-dependent epimerase/dehydratase family protein
VNSSPFKESQARDYLDRLSAETGLPVSDPVRYGVENLLDAIQAEERRFAAAL